MQADCTQNASKHQPKITPLRARMLADMQGARDRSVEQVFLPNGPGLTGVGMAARLRADGTRSASQRNAPPRPQNSDPHKTRQ